MRICGRDAPGQAGGWRRLLFVFLFFFFLFVLFLNVAVFLGLFVLFLFFFLVLVQIFGDGIELDGVRLKHFKLHFALRATQNLAFFYFVFVHVNFRGTIRAANHGCVLLEFLLRVPAQKGRAAPTGVLYTVEQKVICSV